MNRRIWLYVALLGAGAAFGAVASTLTASDPAPVDAPERRVPAAQASFARPAAGDDAAVADMLESLSTALIQESEYRLELEARISELNERVDALQAQLAAPGERRAMSREFDERRRRSGQPLTVERLVEAGMNADVARALKTRLDDIAMQRLYLRDQATREGWMGEQRYREEAQRLAAAQNNIRQEFGDDAYDRYLYASGRPNRVEIQNVLENSPAAEAGLRAGDQILAYNDARTYGPGDLRRAAQGGSAGETVALQVVRNGETVTLYLPRGPLGVQMTGVSAKP